MSAQAAERISSRTGYADNIYFRDGTVVTAILVGLLYMLLAVSLDAAGYVESLAVLIPVTLGALAVGFLMSMSRFDGFFALSHSMFTGLAWILFLMSQSVTKIEIAQYLSIGIPEQQAQAYFVLLRWLSWVDAALNNSASADNYVFIFEMAFLVWWLTYLGVWSIFRYGYTWRAVAPSGIVLLINAYYAPHSIMGFLVVFILLAMLLLVRTNLSEQQLRWREQHVHYSQDIALDFLRDGILFSVIVLALALIAPGLGRNLQVRAVLTPINQRWEETQQRVNRLYQGLNRQTGAGTAFGNTLTLSGARNVTDDIVFTVQTPMGRYWRAVVYDTFTGRTWLSTASEEMSFGAEETVPVAQWGMRQPITQTVTLAAPTGYTIVAMPDIIRTSIPIAATVGPIPRFDEIAADEAAPQVEVLAARARRLLNRGDSYTVVSHNTMVTEAALRAAGTDYPAEILDQYLQLPDNFSAQVAADALSITAEKETAYDKARAIELYLRGFEYNDAIEAPPEGRDPVEYFLYDIREGYCDYYATSMAVMLRSLGIPARLASGYAEGFYDEDRIEYIVTRRDAHTWVEVYFPGYGWIEFEPTAGESQLNRPSGIEDLSNPYEQDRAFAAPGDLPDELNESELNDPFADPNPLGENPDLEAATSTLASRTWWLWSLVIPILLTAGLVFLWRFKFTIPTEFDANLPPILYDRLQRWAARLGLPLSPALTPYENARTLSHAIPEGRAPIESITESYVQYCFSGKRTDGAAPHARKAWKDLQPVLWRAWLHRLVRRKSAPNNNHYSLIDQ